MSDTSAIDDRKKTRFWNQLLDLIAKRMSYENDCRCRRFAMRGRDNAVRDKKGGDATWTRIGSAWQRWRSIHPGAPFRSRQTIASRET